MIDPLESELKDLEAELMALRPSPVSGSVRDAIAAGTESQPASRGSFRPLAWLALAAAAIVLMVGVGLRLSRTQKPAAPDFKPVSAEDVVTAVQDNGEVTLGDGTTARRIDMALVETVVWKDPHTNETLSWSQPREEIRIIPVSYQ